MGKLTTLQQKVEDYIENNRIHLSSFALFNSNKFKNKEAMDVEIKHARVVLAGKLVEKLMSEDKMKQYLRVIPPEKEETDTTLEFEVFIFSGAQIRSFIELIQSHGIVKLFPNSKIIH